MHAASLFSFDFSPFIDKSIIFPKNKPLLRTRITRTKSTVSCSLETNKEKEERTKGTMRSHSSSSSSFSSSLNSWSSSFLVVLVLLLSLLLVSLIVFASDSNTSAFWFSSSTTTPTSFSSPSFYGEWTGLVTSNNGGSESSKESYVELREQGEGGAAPFVSLRPWAAPLSPAPEPAGPFVIDSESKEESSQTRRAWQKDKKLERLELDLLRVRAAIREALQNQNQTSELMDKDYTPRGPTYRSAKAFHRSYLEMEKLFRVYVYEEGEPPLFHDGPCRSIYSVEGRFIHNMEMESRLRTRDPDRAHVHFLPFSVVKMVRFIYQPSSFNTKSLKRTIRDYVNTIWAKYPYWNRSLGADHFMLSCHDWGPISSKAISHLYYNSIRVLCNANTSEGFNPSKDVSLPEINLETELNTGIIKGPSPSGRPILAFFAGGLHGPIRPILLKHWKDKDQDVQVYEYLPKGVSYYEKMKRSRFCLCPSGYEVASPRVVEAMYLECVPVIISDHYVLPFSDVLNWKAFSVQVSVEDIPNIKKILMGISSRQYIRMQRRVKMVQRHFIVNTPPKRFDVYHMILHSIWLRRLNIRIHPQD